MTIGLFESVEFQEEKQEEESAELQGVGGTLAQQLACCQQLNFVFWGRDDWMDDNKEASLSWLCYKR